MRLQFIEFMNLKRLHVVFNPGRMVVGENVSLGGFGDEMFAIAFRIMEESESKEK